MKRAGDQVARQESQYGGQKMQTAISVGATVLGALFGRRTRSAGIGRATTAARQAGRAVLEREDVVRAEAGLAQAEQQRHALDAEFEAEVRALDASVDPASPDTVVLKLQDAVPEGAFLSYGFGLDPIANLIDAEDMAAPVFGPLEVVREKK